MAEVNFLYYIVWGWFLTSLFVLHSLYDFVLQEAAKPKELKREEWMLVPPSSSDLLGRMFISPFIIEPLFYSL